jgi:lipooligosaccharide transport system permease protein
MKISPLVARDLLDVPHVGLGAVAVWSRNFLSFRYTMTISFFWVLFEPMLYLTAIGIGLGSFVREVQGQPYVQFFLPGLIASSGAIVAFYESSYSSYTKLTKQRTFHSMLLAPLRPDDISIGEILWAATKGFVSSFGVLMVGLMAGILNAPLLLPALVFMALNCWIFAALGFLMAAWAKSSDWFVYSQSGLVIPMTLFCGTYFPVESMPHVIQWIVFTLPLTHAVSATRTLFGGEVLSSVFMSMAVLFVYSFMLTNLATAAMRRRLLI